jgi:hypothetical protein
MGIQSRGHRRRLGVFARDIDDNRELLAYFHDRRAWLVEADETPPRVSPYQAPPMKIIYLHGFASSPQSSNAQWFRRRFKEVGAELQIPDLSAGNFERP